MTRKTRATHMRNPVQRRQWLLDTKEGATDSIWEGTFELDREGWISYLQDGRAVKRLCAGVTILPLGTGKMIEADGNAGRDCDRHIERTELHPVDSGEGAAHMLFS